MQIPGANTGAAARANIASSLRALAARPDKDAVRSGASKALSSSLMSGADQAKAHAKARVQQVVERLKILRKLFAFDPKRMAQALAQVFKELRAAVKAYAKAGGDELGAAGSAAGMAVSADAAPTDKDAGSGDEADSKSPDAAVRPPGGDHALYEAVTAEVRKTIGEDGLDFGKSVRALAQDIAKLLETARTQARAKKPDDEMTRAFEDADRALGELHDQLSAMKQDIHVAAPMAGLRLSVEA